LPIKILLSYIIILLFTNKGIKMINLDISPRFPMANHKATDLYSTKKNITKTHSFAMSCFIAFAAVTLANIVKAEIPNSLEARVLVQPETGGLLPTWLHIDGEVITGLPPISDAVYDVCLRAIAKRNPFIEKNNVCVEHCDSIALKP
jgi:hypothetical protein